MDYIAALHALKNGKTVYRRSWKGNGFVRAETTLVYYDADDGWTDDEWRADHADMNAWDWVEGVPAENEDTATSTGSPDAHRADGAHCEPAMPDIAGIMDEISMSLMALKIALLKMDRVKIADTIGEINMSLTNIKIALLKLEPDKTGIADSMAEIIMDLMKLKIALLKTGVDKPGIACIMDEISMSFMKLKIALLNWQINAEGGQSCCKDLLNACTVKGWSAGQKEEKE